MPGKKGCTKDRPSESPPFSREERSVSGGGARPGAERYRLKATAGLGDTETVGERLSGAWHQHLENSGEVMWMVQKGLPTPPCPGMQTNRSLPCSWCWFDGDLAGCASVLDIPGTRGAGENCRVVRRLLWRVRRRRKRGQY